MIVRIDVDLNSRDDKILFMERKKIGICLYVGQKMYKALEYKRFFLYIFCNRGPYSNADSKHVDMEL